MKTVTLTTEELQLILVHLTKATLDASKSRTELMQKGATMKTLDEADAYVDQLRAIRTKLAS